MKTDEIKQKAKENELLTDMQLLSVVEWLASREEDKDSKKDLNAIYKFVHSHRKEGCCKNPHEDWRKEAVDVYYRLLELGEI